MGSLTANTPKPLLRAGGRPLIERIATGLARAGVTRLLVVTGYLGEQIEAALGTGDALGVEISYCRQAHADGTARALLLAEPYVAGASFVLSWGDILVPEEFYAELMRAYERDPCDVRLAVNETDDPWQGAAVYVTGDWRVTRLDEKPPRGTATTRWNNAGILALAPVVFDYARRLAPSPRGEYELPQAIAQMVRDGRNVRAQPIRGFWSDVGTPADLARAEQWLSAERGVVAG